MRWSDNRNVHMDCYLISLYRNGMSTTELVDFIQDKFESRIEAHVYLTTLLRRYKDGLFVQYDGYSDSGRRPRTSL